VVDFPVPPEHYNIPSYIPEYLAESERRIDYITGVQDLSAIAKAQQIPGADTLEKLLEMAGPIVQDMIRAVEEPLTFLGELRKGYYFQFYTYPRILQLTNRLGESADYDYMPDLLIPAIRGENLKTRNDRAKLYLHDFYYAVTQSGINELNRMTAKLFYLQLQKLGFPISWWSIAKVSQIPNFGPEPEGTNNELERYVAQQRIMAELAQDQAAAMGAMAPDRTPQAGELPSGGAQGAGGENRGRPQSLQQAPKLESKDGGTRSTVTTS
jgi:hypothetical protein